MRLVLRLVDPAGTVIGKAEVDVSASMAHDPALHLAQLVAWTGVYRHTAPVNPGLPCTVEVSEAPSTGRGGAAGPAAAQSAPGE